MIIANQSRSIIFLYTQLIQRRADLESLNETYFDEQADFKSLL